MSILIKDIRLPENCHECPCCDQTYWDEDDELICTCNISAQDTTCFSSEKREDCPLVEVPEFSSDLIERDAVLNVCEFIGERNDMEYLGDDNYAARADEIEKIPAIIGKED